MVPCDVGASGFPVSRFWRHEEEEGRNVHGGGPGDSAEGAGAMAERGGGQSEEAGGVAKNTKVIVSC